MEIEKTENPKRGFTGVFIPAGVWNESRLSPTEKFLWAEALSLSDCDGTFNVSCSLQYLSEKLNVSVKTVVFMIEKLNRLGLIENKDDATLKISNGYSYGKK